MRAVSKFPRVSASGFVSSIRRQRNFGLKHVFIFIIAIVSIIVFYSNWMALKFVVTELQCSRSADTRLRSKQLAYSKPLVYTCGYSVAATIAELVFDDRKMLKWDGSQGNPYDILILSGLCNCVSSFRGNIYIILLF